jgi:uncharacterized protein YaeQ
LWGETALSLNATIYTFDITLNDTDRGVYETVSFRIARHPSETEEFLLTRVLAYCLEYTEGIEFSKGLSEPDAPAIAVRDLTGLLSTWIDIGTPEATRLHKASKLARRVVVYAHRDVRLFLDRLQAEPLHRKEALRVQAIDRVFLSGLVAMLERRMVFNLAVADHTLYLSVGETTLTGTVELFSLTA